MAHGTATPSPPWRTGLVAGLVEVCVAQLIVAVEIGPSAANAGAVHLAAAIGVLQVIGLSRLILASRARWIGLWILPPLSIVAVTPLLLGPATPWMIGVAPALAAIWGARLLTQAIPSRRPEADDHPLSRRLAALFATTTAAALLSMAGTALARGGATPTSIQWIAGLIGAPMTVALAALTGGLVGAILRRDVLGTAQALTRNHLHPQRPIRVTRDDRIGAVQEGLESLRLRLLDELARHEEQIAHVREGAAARAEFIAALSREIEVATAGIRGEIEALSDDTDDRDADPRSPEIAAREAVDGLTARVRELADLALLEADALRLVIVAVDLTVMLDEVVAAHADDARARGLTIERRGASALPRVPGDAARLRQILEAMIGAAIEAAEPATLGIDGRLVEEAVTLTIALQGRSPAIRGLVDALAEEDLPGSNTRAGRSLRFARALANAHGGELRATRDPSGAYLILGLPLQPPDEPSDADAAHVARRGDRPRRRITPPGRAA